MDKNEYGHWNMGIFPNCNDFLLPSMNVSSVENRAT